MSIPESHLYRQFQAVFDTYYNSLCNYAFTFTKNAESSEDIVQELFIKIWEDRRDLLMKNTIRYYLFTAVRNNSISWLRQEKKVVLVEWNEHEETYAMAVQPAAAGAATSAAGAGSLFGEERVAVEDYREILEKGMATLPPKCREVFVLSRFSHMSYKEIASSLGISVKTVENQLGKALKILRVFLRENGVYLAYALVNFFW
ncbi:MAG TPA: RNA polymerase sigma-70 factor [Puia sp.]|jgi:RNA polymerase sigma-70 factor (ECF subfamily)